MNTFRDLILKHRGKRICVMGGSPQLADHLCDVRADVWISANDHGARLMPVDYVVAMDDVHTEKRVPLRDLIRSVTDAPIIGPWDFNDYYLDWWPGSPRKHFSGLIAIWIAWAMGAHPVIAAGFSNYAEGTDEPQYNRARDYTKVIADHVPKASVRVVGGTLGGVWCEYNAGEKYGRYRPHSSINGLLGIDEIIEIEFRKPTTVRGREWPKGTRLTIGRHEVATLLKHRMVVEV